MAAEDTKLAILAVNSAATEFLVQYCKENERVKTGIMEWQNEFGELYRTER